MADSYTKAQFRTKVRDLSRDEASVDSDRAVQNAEIDGWVQDALVDLSWRTRSIRKELSSTMPDATGHLAFPADCISVEYMSLGTDDVEFIDAAAWFAQKADGSSPPHTVGRIQDKIYLYPAPDAGAAYVLGIVVEQETLSADTDEPDLPRRWQTKVIQYALSQMMLFFRNYDAADRYMSMYESGLPPKPLNDRIMPAPLAFAPYLGVFDTDPDSRHK